MKGNLTVEAAYIFPLCFLFIGIICYLGIFEYNKAVLKMTGYECILHTVENYNLKESIFLDQLLEHAMENASERTLGIEELNVKAKITTSKISLYFQGTQKMFQTPMEVNVIYERTYPEQILRMNYGKESDRYGGTAEAGIE